MREVDPVDGADDAARPAAAACRAGRRRIGKWTSSPVEPQQLGHGDAGGASPASRRPTADRVRRGARSTETAAPSDLPG